MNKDYFSSQIAPTLPNAPGIYRYYNAGKKIIYVGKAIDLKKRISSYFLKQDHNAKTQALVEEIAHIEFTVTPSEHDAFLLENSLIKHFKPHYNIALKDDKSYPFVVITNEDFPRVFLTRRYVKDGSEYIGPFTDVYTVKQLLKLIKLTIPLRTCTLPLTPKSIAKKKFKSCLEYHLGNCLAPCEGLQSKEQYQESIKTVRKILKGNLSSVIKDLKQQMDQAAQAWEFEKANQLKKQIEAFKNYESKSTVFSTKLGDLDTASIIETKQYAFVNYLVVREGLVLHSKTIHLEKKLDESPEVLLSFGIAAIRPSLDTSASEIILPFKVMLEDESIIQTIPIAGEKRKILDMSFSNAQHQKVTFEKKKSLLLKEKSDADNLQVLEEIQKDLKLPHLPRHIECFDNSNFQGSYPVAAMVCFKDGQAFKKEYKKFHIKTVEGINDFASMEEIVFRRYKKLKDTAQPLPDLVIIDGGKGQLGAAMNSINKLELNQKMVIMGLAKREELLFFPGEKEPVSLPMNGKSMLLIRRIRDEVHRFGITFHRATRSKGSLKNELENIKGIGSKTAQQLLLTFRSVEKIKQLSIATLSETIGKGKAQIVYQYFHEKQEEN